MSGGVAHRWPGDQLRHDMVTGLGERLERRSVPGVAIALLDGGRAVETIVVGRRNAVEPIADDTVFEVASLSKPVFAHTVLSLVADGLLDLDEPLTRWFADDAPPVETWGGLAAGEPGWAEITARHVLSHSSGMGNWQDDRINRVTTVPGCSFSYSGEAYILLQRAIEVRTGASLEDLARARTLDPLDMADSSFVWRESTADRAAEGHGDRNEGAERKWAEGWSAFSLASTVTDYARFWTALLTSPDPAFAAMCRKQIAVTEDVAWGLGVGLERSQDRWLLWQWGDLGDVTSLAIGDPDSGHGVVAMTNGAQGLLVCRFIIRTLFGGEHPCFDDVILKP